MIAFRCDGDLRVGAGHAARCLQLARAFEAAGDSVVFVGAYDGIAKDLLATAGIATMAPLPGGPLGAPEGTRAAVVDSYELTVEEIEEAGRMLPVAALVDDGHAPSVAAVLAYHLDADQRITASKATTAILGADYAPVRPEVAAARRDRGFARALVTVGGGAAGLALAEQSAQTLLALDPALEVFVAAPGASRVSDPRLAWGIEQGGLADRIAWADVAVSAAGSTPYDLACAGVPAALEAVAPNQAPIRAAFIERGLAVPDAGALRDPATRAELAAAGPAIVDGYGAFRARDALLAAFAGSSPPRVLRYRPARDADAELLLGWRNEPEVRAMSRNTDVIALDVHVDWLRGVLADPDRTLLVVEQDGSPIGTVRFDRADRAAEISVAIASGARGGGLGAQVIGEATELQLASYAGVERVLAEVQRHNLRSLRAFERAGYVPAAEDPALDSALLVRGRAPLTQNPLAQEQR